jgi:hypothetical protein
MIEQAIEQAKFLLRLKGFYEYIPADELETIINDTRKIFPEVDADILRKHIQFYYAVFQNTSKTIAKDYTPWLQALKAKTEWRFWPRYLKLLQEVKKYPAKALKEIDISTDDTLDYLHNPLSKENFDKRGLVVGHVQSGKTANFIGLICKAADMGYKFIIVLAGIHNSLRAQTQMRIDEGFLGYDNQHYRINKELKYVGVGKFLEYRQNAVAHSITTSQSDFTTNTANSIGINFDTSEPIIAIVKKNATVLNKLYQWLETQAISDEHGIKSISNKSLLIIDDEADNASINTNKKELDPSRINMQIRSLLELFNKSGYVGYTATPFANIFIPLDEDNLFPRNFITNLEAPSNYIGPDKIFGFEPVEDNEIRTDTLPVVCPISDYQDFVPDKHKINVPDPDKLEVNMIPESLCIAIKTFILTCAVRRLRGQENEHNSMLIHLSRFKDWQKGTRRVIEAKFIFYRNGIDQNIPSVINEFRKAYELDNKITKSFATISQNILDSELRDIDPSIAIHDWAEVRPMLYPAIMKIEIKELHGDTKDALDYELYDKKNIPKGQEAGLSVIAIGGNKLSRGLTLEGLSVSYYLRASKMYDTLMQMGRWFGYRNGYVDLCRLFTTKELNEWFCHITLASNELRKEFNYMTKIKGVTPREYALKVRTHPINSIQVSANNKIRNTVKMNFSWAGALIESYKLSTEEIKIINNLNAANKLISKMDKNPISKAGFLWYNIAPELIIDFLISFKAPSNPASDTAFLAKYIEDRIKENELISWRVAVMSKQNAENPPYEINGLKINLYDRIRDSRNESSEDIYYINRSHIISPTHEIIDLSKEEKVKAMELTKIKWEQDGNKGEPKYCNGNIVRNQIRKPENPLLLIYYLDPVKADIDTTNPIVGFAISFPGSRNKEGASFLVNSDLLEFNEPEDFENYED